VVAGELEPALVIRAPGIDPGVHHQSRVVMLDQKSRMAKVLDIFAHDLKIIDF
jgi:hypothetical protein